MKLQAVLTALFIIVVALHVWQCLDLVEVVLFAFVVLYPRPLVASPCFSDAFWDRERLLTSHVTSATVLLACLTLTLGRDAVDLTPAVTSLLALIDQTRDCMRVGLVIDEMNLVLACARYWMEVDSACGN